MRARALGPSAPPLAALLVDPQSVGRPIQRSRQSRPRSCRRGRTGSCISGHSALASPVSFALAPFVAGTWDTTPDAEDDDYRDLSGDAITIRESIDMNLYRDAGAPEIRPQCNLATARNLFRKEGLTKEFLAHHQDCHGRVRLPFRQTTWGQQSLA